MDAKTRDLIAAMAKAKKWWTVPEIEKVFENGEVQQKAEKPAKVAAPAMKKAAGKLPVEKKAGKKAKGSKKSKAEKIEAAVEATPEVVEVPA